MVQRHEHEATGGHSTNSGAMAIEASYENGRLSDGCRLDKTSRGFSGFASVGAPTGSAMPQSSWVA